MKKKITAILILIFMFTNVLNITTYAQETPQISAPSVIMIDAATGKILYEKDSNKKMYPASTTKIMTAVIALENGNLNDTVTASSKAIMSIDFTDSSNMGTLIGEQLSLKDLLYGLMVCSANEAANVIAEHIAGSVDKFVELMNKKAKQLGAVNTHYVNPHGLHNDNHYTTAHDMAIIAKYAMTLPEFRKLVATSHYQIEPTNKYFDKRYFSNTNLLINESSVTPKLNYFYKYATGIKTGYTSKANHTLVGAAKKNGVELITVVMGAKFENNKYYSYVDTINLFEYGFNNFNMQTIVRKNEIVNLIEVPEAKNNEKLIVTSDDSIETLLPNGYDINNIEKVQKINPDIKAPITKGDIVGTVTYKYGGIEVGKINLIADKNIKQNKLIVIKSELLKMSNSLWFKIIIGILLFIIISYIFLVIAAKRRNKKRRYSLIKNKYHNKKNKW